MKITVLGCGASGGVPLITGDWGKCNSANPRNRRRRASILVQIQGKNILIDTGPDLREQLLAAGIKEIDVILYTHGHADHTGGIEDLRQMCLKMGRRIPVYADSQTLQRLQQSYEYIFTTLDPQYPSFLEGRLLENPLVFEGVQIKCFQQYHGNEMSWGFRMGDFAYSTDIIDLPPESYDMLKGLKLWMVDCLRETPHIGHAHFEHTLALIDKVKPDEAVLTHMSHHLDYDDMCHRLPTHVRPAYDGMILTSEEFPQ